MLLNTTVPLPGKESHLHLPVSETGGLLLSHPAKMEPQLGSAPRRLLYERSGFLISLLRQSGTAGRLRSGVGGLEDRGPTIERLPHKKVAAPARFERATFRSSGEHSPI